MSDSPLAGRAVPLSADLADAEQAAGLLDRAQHAVQQPLDVLVLNAGLSTSAPLGELPLAEFDRVFAVNARALFLLLSNAATALTDGGRIITISTAGTASPQDSSAHVASPPTSSPRA